jgi:hypothetical protein
MSRQLLRRQNTRTGGRDLAGAGARECRVAQQPCWAADSENGSGKDMSRGRVTWLGFSISERDAMSGDVGLDFVRGSEKVDIGDVLS